MVASWCLYDFANSWYVAVVPATIWAAYYANAIVGNEAGRGDLWWGRVASMTALFVAVTSPVLGSVADHLGIRKRLMLGYAGLAIAVTALLPTVKPGMVLYGFWLGLLANVGFEGSLLFYNAYLPEIAPAGHQGRVSGWGFATGYAGSFLALLCALPLVRAENFAGAFLLVAAAYFVFMLPAWRWLPAQKPSGQGFRQAAAEGLRGTRRTFRDILRIPELRRFLLAYFLFEDGVNTVVVFSSIFAATTLGFGMPDLIRLYLVVQASAVAGAWLWSRPTDRLGPKRVLMAMLVLWTLVVIASYFVRTPGQFFVLAAVAGSGLGPVQAAARTFMSTLVPRGREGEMFGFYALCGKSASVIGPLIFGSVSAATGGDQRLALLSVLPLFVAGGVVLAGVEAGGPTRAAGPLAPVTGGRR
ncbi:MAG: MFS transporter [Gemmatimonadetes bacterium]|nr:MFS transporter [Gemmatimonadota bacterium]